MAIWGDFQGLTGVTGGGREFKKFEKWVDVIYGWSLTPYPLYLFYKQRPILKTDWLF